MDNIKIKTLLKNKYIYVNIPRLIMRQILSEIPKIILGVNLIYFKDFIKFLRSKYEEIYLLAPGQSLDDFNNEKNNKSIYLGISKVISHKINCDYYLCELRFYNLKKYIIESLKKIKYHKPKGFIIKGYCSPTTILPSLIFILFMKFYKCKIFLISEIYVSDITNKPKYKYFNYKLFLEKLDSFILLGRTYWDFKFLENFTDKFIFVGFDKSSEYASKCDWEGNKHKYTFNID